MKPNIKILLTSLAISLLAACGNDSTSNSSSAIAVEAAKNGQIPAASLQMSVDAVRSDSSMSQKSAMSTRSAGAAPAATVIDLGAPIASMETQAKNVAYEMGKPLQVSFGRDVSQTSTAALTQQVFNWQSTLTGGNAAAVSITSKNAKALRLGLLINKLPDSATVRFYNQKAGDTYTVSGKEILTLIANNAAAGDTSAAGRTFWSQVIEGTEATVEIELPAGISTSEVNAALPQVSHFFMTASTAASVKAMAVSTWSWANDGLSCQVDIKCTAPTVASDSVADLIYQKNGSGYICTGTLLNNSANNFIPYLLTANHCISDQTTASTLTTWWMYRSSGCNITSGTYQQVAGGGLLKYTAYNTDATLLQMNAAPPAGTLFAGWDASPQTVATPVVGIHHPKQDAQRISSGTIVGYFNRNPNVSNSFPVSTQAKSTMMEVMLTNGIVEGGSSGSAIFKDAASANPQVIGQLYGGELATCAAPSVSNTQSTVYGRFDYAFAAGMSDWLSPTRKPVYRFYNTQLGSHFFTINGVERNSVIGSLPQFAYEGVSFFAYPSTVGPAGLSPVHRFYNTKTGTHFLTISAAEQQYVLDTFPQFKYEGISWYAQAGAGNGTMPLYRFYRTDNKTHFYTVSLAERDYVIATLGAYFNYEGIAYYVWPSVN